MMKHFSHKDLTWHANASTYGASCKLGLPTPTVFLLVTPLLAATLTGCSALSSIASAIPAVSAVVGGANNNYEPFYEGEEWDYNVLDTNGNKKLSVKVTFSNVKTNNGVATATSTAQSTNLASNQTNILTYTETRTSDSYQETDSKGMISTLLKYPLAVNSQWQSLGITLTAEGQEDVVVSAGTFKNAWKISGTSPTDSSTSATKWMDKDTGMVKAVISSGGQSLTFDLQKYTKP